MSTDKTGADDFLTKPVNRIERMQSFCWAISPGWNDKISSRMLDGEIKKSLETQKIIYKYTMSM